MQRGICPQRNLTEESGPVTTEQESDCLQDVPDEESLVKEPLPYGWRLNKYEEIREIEDKLASLGFTEASVKTDGPSRYLAAGFYPPLSLVSFREYTFSECGEYLTSFLIAQLSLKTMKTIFDNKQLLESVFPTEA